MEGYERTGTQKEPALALQTVLPALESVRLLESFPQTLRKLCGQHRPTSRPLVAQPNRAREETSEAVRFLPHGWPALDAHCASCIGVDTVTSDQVLPAATAQLVTADGAALTVARPNFPRAVLAELFRFC